MIFILSVSAVSAETMDNEDSFLVNDSDLIDLTENLYLSDNLSDDLENNLDDESDIASYSDSQDIVLEDNPNSDENPEWDPNENPDDDNDTDNETLKNTTLTIVSKDNWAIYGVKNYTVKLFDEDNNPVCDALINFKIKTPEGTYVKKSSYTDENGKAILTLNFTMRGVYNILVSYNGDENYNPAESADSNVIFYEKTGIRTPKKYSYVSSNFTIKIITSLGNILSNQKLTIYVDGVKYTKTTDSKGQVYIKMPSDRKSVNLTCCFDGYDYLASSNMSMILPVYKKTFTKPLVFSVLKGKYFKVLLKGIDGKILKSEKINITINGKTYLVKTNSKGIAYLKITVSRGAYKVKFSYGNNSVYGPSSNSSTLNVIDPSGQFKRGLNQNTELSVSKYLYGGGYAKITKSIRNLAKKITSKYTTKLEKATAIFNYVRDNLDYSYYANSRKGAAKTLKTKRGNCCDHANLIVALCRASKIPARYSHAKGCRFKSGLVTGHVWAQIYVDGRWYSADGTSYRNSLGHIRNWNVKNYHSYHSYRNIPF